jgi:hypothetical protein
VGGGKGQALIQGKEGCFSIAQASAQNYGSLSGSGWRAGQGGGQIALPLAAAGGRKKRQESEKKLEKGIDTFAL